MSLMLTAKRHFIVSPNPGFRVGFNARTMTGFTLYLIYRLNYISRNTVMQFLSPNCVKVSFFRLTQKKNQRHQSSSHNVLVNNKKS